MATLKLKSFVLKTQKASLTVLPNVKTLDKPVKVTDNVLRHTVHCRLSRMETATSHSLSHPVPSRTFPPCYLAKAVTEQTVFQTLQVD